MITRTTQLKLNLRKALNIHNVQTLTDECCTSSEARVPKWTRLERTEEKKVIIKTSKNKV